MKNKIFSIGHSNRAFSEFLEKLQEHNVDTVIDVRTFPRSRFCPQYNRKALDSALGEVGVEYLFRGENLGGRGENVDYQATIDEVVNMAKEGKQVCVMCSEAKHTDCHRHDTLEPSFGDQGLEMVHISY